MPTPSGPGGFLRNFRSLRHKAAQPPGPPTRSSRTAPAAGFRCRNGDGKTSAPGRQSVGKTYGKGLRGGQVPARSQKVARRRSLGGRRRRRRRRSWRGCGSSGITGWGSRGALVGRGCTPPLLGLWGWNPTPRFLPVAQLSTDEVCILNGI